MGAGLDPASPEAHCLPVPPWTVSPVAHQQAGSRAARSLGSIKAGGARFFDTRNLPVQERGAHTA